MTLLEAVLSLYLLAATVLAARFRRERNQLMQLEQQERARRLAAEQKLARFPRQQWPAGAIILLPHPPQQAYTLAQILGEQP